MSDGDILCLQFGTSRIKVTLWDGDGHLREAAVAPVADTGCIRAWIDRPGLSKIRYIGVHAIRAPAFPRANAGMPAMTPIPRRALRDCCEFNNVEFERVGMDRLLFAAAVRPLGRCPCVCVDFGSYTTVNFISAAGALSGGWIIPGMRVSLASSALVSPQLKTMFEDFCFAPIAEGSTSAAAAIMVPQDARQTKDALLAGFYHQYGAIIQSLVKTRLPIYVTGGYAEPLKRMLPSHVYHDPYWVERGMLEVIKHEV